MTTFKREKPHVRIDRIGKKLTPIERAGNALLRNRAYQAGVAFGVPDETESEAKHRTEIIKAVFESIDTDELANAIAEHLAAASGWPGRGDKMLHNAIPIAQAVKNWLTNDTPD